MSGFRLTSQGKLQLSENDVERSALDVLGLRRLFVRRQHVGKFLPGKVLGLLCPACRYAVRRSWITMGEAGDADYVVVAPPGFFLEVKRPGAKPADHQLQRFARLEDFFHLKTLVVANVDKGGQRILPACSPDRSVCQSGWPHTSGNSAKSGHS